MPYAMGSPHMRFRNYSTGLFELFAVGYSEVVTNVFWTVLTSNNQAQDRILRRLSYHRDGALLVATLKRKLGKLIRTPGGKLSTSCSVSLRLRILSKWILLWRLLCWFSNLRMAIYDPGFPIAHLHCDE